MISVAILVMVAFMIAVVYLTAEPVVHKIHDLSAEILRKVPNIVANIIPNKQV